MRAASLLILAVALTSAYGVDTPTPRPACTNCRHFSKHELKQARQDIADAVQFEQSGRYKEAIEATQRATATVDDPQIVTAAELVRQHVVSRYIEEGNKLLTSGNNMGAALQFQAALQVDPQSELARQRLNEVRPAAQPQTFVEDQSEQLEPLTVNASPGVRNFQIRGMSRDLLTQVAQSFGLTATFDDSVKNRPVRFDVDNIGFQRAMDAASHLTGTFWVPVTANQILVANDSPDQHRQYDRMMLRTFYVSNTNGNVELNEVVQALRSAFDLRFIAVQPGNNSITVRAPAVAMAAIEKFMRTFPAPKPQVMLDVNVFQISSDLTRQLGLGIPTQWQMINVPAAALAALAGGNAQNLLNQLISSGAINAANSTALSALLAQLQNQNGNSLLQTPFGTFGGGISRFAVPFPATTVNLQLNESSVRDLQHISLRASQNTPATLLVGSRYPILNASYAPIYNSAAISQVLGNQSYIAPIPSFQYEDLGVKLKATPLMQGTSAVNLKIELSIRSLAGQSINGVPVLVNREYGGSITLDEGQEAVVVGSLSNSEQLSLTGIPGLSYLPLFGSIIGTRTRQYTTDELLVVITPRILSAPQPSGAATEVYLPSAQ